MEKNSAQIVSRSNIFNLSLTSDSPEKTSEIARSLGKILRGGEILALVGDLGSGKTLFVRGLAEGLGIRDTQEVRSPTFAIIQEHRGRVPLCHADLYRLAPAEIPGLGLEEYWAAESRWVVAVEWADRMKEILPESSLRLKFSSPEPNVRTILFAGGELWNKKLKSWPKKISCSSR
jgi:tRNA threonylcarbamoyladenosine biosynthesis protein TsaE